jgi:predicted ArsR family transcriptional regulator
MFAPGVRELLKPQWIAVVEELKRSGGMAVPALAKAIGMSYMGTKQHCEALKKAGYLESWRVPRQQVGRPEILYRLTAKTDGLFPGMPASLVFGLLDAARGMFGDMAPERLLRQYFEQLRTAWAPKVQRGKSLVEKATRLADLREKEGVVNACKFDSERGFRIEELHHPLRQVFAAYPRTVAIETRLFEDLLGTKITRREIPGGRAGPAKVEFEISTLGVKVKK